MQSPLPGATAYISSESSQLCFREFFSGFQLGNLYWKIAIGRRVECKLLSRGHLQRTQGTPLLWLRAEMEASLRAADLQTRGWPRGLLIRITWGALTTCCPSPTQTFRFIWWGGREEIRHLHFKEVLWVILPCRPAREQLSAALLRR